MTCAHCHRVVGEQIECRGCRQIICVWCKPDPCPVYENLPSAGEEV
jgi:hypothetical protein